MRPWTSIAPGIEFARFATMALALASMGSASVAESRGLELGPRIAFSRPTGKAAQLLTPGVAYGMTATFVEGPRRGYGLDIIYHRWPGSPEVDRRLDQFLSAILDAPISGSRTTVSAVQATMHGKQFALERGPVLPWMKIGVGIHRFNQKLELPVAAIQAAGARVETRPGGDISYELGILAGVGLDLEITANTKLSLDVAYHLITTEEPFATAFSIGLCLLDRPR